MTIGSTTIQTSGSTGNGATTQFSFSFSVEDYGGVDAEAQVQVIRETISSGAEEILTLTTDYSVTLNGDQNSSPGGSITMVSAPSSSYKIWIRLNPSFLQATDLQSQGGFQMETVEDQWDQQQRQINVLRDRVNKAPRAGVQAGTAFSGEITGDMTAGYAPVLNAGLTGFVWGNPAAAGASAAMTPVVQASTLAAGQIALGVRRNLAANERYYIAPAVSGGNDANDGLTALTPKLTFETLYNTLRDTIETKGYVLAFTIAAGAYTQSFVARGAIPGVKDQAECSIEFASGVTISTTGMPCLDAYDGAICKFSGNPTCTASGSFAYGIRIWKDANVTFGGMNFGACTLYQIYIAGAKGRRIADVTHSGNAQIGELVEVNGQYDKGSYESIFSGTPTYSGHPSSAFFVAGEGSHAATHSATYSGSFNGRKYYNSDLASVTPINKLEDIPGSLEGVWANPVMSTPQGRLTLETGVPVSTSDQTAKTTVYYQPYEGDYAPFSLSGSNAYEMCTIGVSGLSLALDSDSGHTGYHQSGKNFDLFLYRRGSSAVFTLATGPAWTNDSTRAAAISRPNGILANTSSMTVRFGTGSSDTETLSAGEGVYVGSIRCSANGQTADAVATRYVYNEYNQLPRDSKAKTGSPFYSAGEMVLTNVMAGLLFGMTLSNNGSDATNDIDIAAGSCIDSTGVRLMVGTALTKQLDATWAAGTNAGGKMSAAAIANTTYHVFAIYKDSDGTVDYGFDVSATAPTMPTGYTYFRRIGSIIRSGGAILGFIQDGDEFTLKASVAGSAANPGTSAVLRAMTVPVGVRVKWCGSIGWGGSTPSTDTCISALVTDPAVTDRASSATDFSQLVDFNANSNAAAETSVWTNTSAQVRTRVQRSTAGTTLYWATAGWIDPRGRA